VGHPQNWGEHDGRSAPNVVFAAVNVNQYYNWVPDVLGYSRAHQLITIPRLAFPDRPGRRPAGRLTRLPRRSPGAQPGRRHRPCTSSAPGGTERCVAEPMADHTSSGAAYLPAGQIAAWGRGIALVARTLSS
jgi:hypothetical protein